MNKKTIKIIIGASALIAVAVVVVVAASVFKAQSPSPDISTNGDVPSSTPLDVASTTVATNTYVHQDPNFILSYPDDLTATSSVDADGSETIVFGGPSQPDMTADHLGFQIFISPYNESAPINQEFVKAAFPLLSIEDPVQVVFGANGDLNGLVFMSTDPTIGRTRELWLAHEGYLYQVTTYAALDSWLAEIFKTLKFSPNDQYHE